MHAGNCCGEKNARQGECTRRPAQLVPTGLQRRPDDGHDIDDEAVGGDLGHLAILRSLPSKELENFFVRGRRGRGHGTAVLREKMAEAYLMGFYISACFAMM